ncbi:MAG TPA: hypothetical protein VM754_00200, partial [Actinomycetota bacterium]|nr:hypothetical protein [Actinomycetota bacterium]
YACCPRDGEPLISTLEFSGAEFVCVVCGQTYGYLAPTAKPATPEREARHGELKERYDAERAERQIREGRA